MTYNIKDFGAIGDGGSLNTEAIQNNIIYIKCTKIGKQLKNLNANYQAQRIQKHNQNIPACFVNHR